VDGVKKGSLRPPARFRHDHAFRVNQAVFPLYLASGKT
jgi:hypothetical protein